ncbi:hypothetical protein PV11_05030 [Exophiala sideris]|uniref:UDP-galactose transporter n=1 Tax=Exophiala sideris TaxID=1016849 RepID=A0A0D1Z894_9EURO|nr:hypothetical protein PV11_05030 [Exophiala sideris]
MVGARGNDGRSPKELARHHTIRSMVSGIPIKYVSLFILMLQNSALVLTMRYSRTRPGMPYLTSAVVVLAEMLKLIASTSVHLYNQYKEHTGPSAGLKSAMNELKRSPGKWFSLSGFVREVFSVQSGFLKICIPAILYTLQNNLQLVAASQLDAATFQVTYQGKILTTALLSVALVHQQLCRRKWASLFFLTIGVAAVQVGPALRDAGKSEQTGSRLVGFVSVAVACVLSGLAGVYFELVLKRSTTSLWIRNIQLSAASLIIASFGAYVWDGRAIRENGFFQGFTPSAVATILLSACGGLIVAVVVKYADNIMKGFATSLSVILSTIVSVILFDFQATIFFLEGASLVFLATYLYSVPEQTLPSEQEHSSEDLEAKLSNKEYIYDGRRRDSDSVSESEQHDIDLEKT